MCVVLRSPISSAYANVRASAKQDRPDYKSHEALDNPDLDRLRKAEEEFRDLRAKMG